MDIFGKSEESISRYNLALLCLPLVTSNGKSSMVNRPKGNDFSYVIILMEIQNHYGHPTVITKEKWSCLDG
jgi:hypothetical protein